MDEMNANLPLRSFVLPGGSPQWMRTRAPSAVAPANRRAAGSRAGFRTVGAVIYLNRLNDALFV
jgi:cob(I)alamin adenosyltransferase